MNSLMQQKSGQDERGVSYYQVQPGTPQARPTSTSVSMSQPPPRQRQPSWPRFFIPTTSDSLSSGFDYDSRLQQLYVTPSDWSEFTRDVVDAAKLSFADNKKAWGAGLATGTAGTLTVLFLGPIAGYYIGKKIHKRTVLQKVRERLLEDGKISNVLRRWNEGAWANRGFHTSLEFPEGDGNSSNRADTDKFRIAIMPGTVVITQFPMISQIPTPGQVELQGEQVFQRPAQQTIPQHQAPQSSQTTLAAGRQPSLLNASTTQTYPYAIQKQPEPGDEPLTQDGSNPPLPARVPSKQNLPVHPTYEMSNTQVSAISELPATQATAKEPVQYYEMDAESIRR